jgi:hypothetical protein
VNDAEGNREQVKTQGGQPGVLACMLLHRGLRPAHAYEGLPRNLGGLVVSGASRNGDAKREAERRRDHEKSECRGRSDDAGEPARGTRPSKGRHRNMEP